MKGIKIFISIQKTTGILFFFNAENNCVWGAKTDYKNPPLQNI